MKIRSFTDLGTPTVTGRIIEGYAAVFDQESKVIYDKEKRRVFVEIIDKGAITEDVLLRSDIKAVLEHNNERLLARCTHGKGSLSLAIDDYGLKYGFKAPNTVDGDFAVEMIGRGDIFGSSFEYLTNDKDPSCVSYFRKNGILIRRVHKIIFITDVSPVYNPAYFGTDVNVRSINELEAMLNDTDTAYLEQIKQLEKLI